MAERQFDGVKLSVAFSKAASLADLSSGENIATSLGKISKMYDSLISKLDLGDVFGTNATQLDSTKDINTTTTQGIYYWVQSSKPANLPKRKLIAANTTLSQGIMLVFRPKNYSSIIQLIIPVNVYDSDGWSIYIRTSTDSRSTELPSVAWHLIESTAEFDTAPTSGSANGITSGAVYTAINGFGDAAIHDVASSITSGDLDLPTSDAVYTALTGAINDLDVSNITANLGRNKTLTALSEADGKISATADTIQITTSQVTDFPTLGTAAAKDYTTTVSSGGADLPTSGSVYSAISDATSGKLVASDVFGLGTALKSTDNIDSLDVGLYYWAGAENKPTSTASTMPALNSATLIQIKNSYDAAFTQFVIPQNPYSSSNTPKVIYIRYKTNSGWQQFDTIEFTSNYDTSPTADSKNACTSGGIASALSGKQDNVTFDGTYNASSNPAATVSTVTSAVSSKQDTLTFDGTYDASTNKAATVSTVTTAVDAVKYGLLGTQLTAGVDLNTMNTPGVYYASSGGSAFGHLPSDWGSIAAFNLYVEQTTTKNTNANRMRQTLMPAALYPSTHPTSPSTVAPKFYVRYKTGSGSGTWSDWIRFDGAIVSAAPVNGTNNLNDPMGGLGNEDI